MKGGAFARLALVYGRSERGVQLAPKTGPRAKVKNLLYNVQTRGGSNMPKKRRRFSAGSVETLAVLLLPLTPLHFQKCF